MDHDRLFALAEDARQGRRFSRGPRRVPARRHSCRVACVPESALAANSLVIREASLSPVRRSGTFLRSALLIAGQKAFGRRYGAQDFYERVEADLAMRVMRAHFHGGAPKGAYCCKPCTLAVLPVLEANAIRYFAGPALAKDAAHDRRTRLALCHAGECHDARLVAGLN